MPSSDYSNTVGGGLKLKGAGGVDKKKKKKKAKKPAEEDENEQAAKEDTIPAEEDGEGQSAALQKALAEEENIGREERDAAKEVSEYGKTEAQRRFEERRKKRVSSSPLHLYTVNCLNAEKVWMLMRCVCYSWTND